MRNAALKIIKDDPLFSCYANGYYDYKVFIQACAICKRVNEEWNYVNDPKGEEYFAKASESIGHLSGDCDDHAVLLASLIRAIGGKTRIVLAPCHAYPEIRVDKRDWDDIQYLIKKVLFEREAAKVPLDYHLEGDYIWLNMDYTGGYPGAQFLNGAKKVSVINI